MSRPGERLAEAHVLVVGAGGIGCPAAWALAAAGVGRVTLLDHDVVERSNLPRQVLYTADDLGKPKAPCAAAALVRRGLAPKGFVGGLHARLDDSNEQALLAGVDVLVDATDGAHAKDWLNQLAVRRGLPLVHAAGLRAEARLMSLGRSGRPCLACLFGRLREETGSCADLGVWNGVVGFVGFLAAAQVVRRLTGTASDATHYAVFDFEVGRATPLRVEADEGCPVCASPGGAVEPYPAPFACAIDPVAAPEGGEAIAAHDLLDLSEERCPLNLLRARRALADRSAGDVLTIRLGAEGAATVPDGVRALGHRVVSEHAHGQELLLRVEVVGARADDPAFDGQALQQYARQIVLPEVGERGQQALADARVWLGGEGPALESARLYLRSAGVGTVLDAAASCDEGDVIAWAGGLPPPHLPPTAVVLTRAACGVRASRSGDEPLSTYDVPAPVALAWGALLADLVQRVVVLADAPMHGFALADDGALATSG